jgi:hypothetical protein
MLHQNRPVEAAQAFETAMQGSTGRARHDAAYGESLALMSAGDSTKAARVAGSADLDAKQRNDIGTQMLEQRAWAAYNSDRFIEALSWLDRRAAFTPETRDLRQMRVYCLQKLNRMEAAQKVQEELDQQLSR